MGYTIRNLLASPDMASQHGLSEQQEARFPWRDLGAEATGLAHLFVKPGQRQPFAHRHRQAEEIYVVLSGSGRVKLDDEVHDIGPLDAIRLPPNVARAFEAGPEGLELLAFGPRHPGDADMIPDDFWG